MASNATEVYIKLPTGRNAKYEVASTSYISELCNKVATEERVSSNQVRLKYQGKTLDTKKTVGQYGVRVETILKAEILIPQTLDLTATLPDGNVEEVVISNLEPVSALYAALAVQLVEAESKLQIKVEGRAITSSSTTLMDSGLARGTNLSVEIIEKPTKTESKTAEGAKADVPMDDDARQAVLNSFDAGGKQVEVAFSFDTTGSMYQYLEEVRRKLRESCTRLIQDIPNIRISVIAQGDYCDSMQKYAVRLLDLTSDVQRLVDFSENVPSTGGGDSPECYELVLKRAQELDWSEDSAKALVVIADDHPHPPSYTDQNIRWRDELELLTGMGVKVYGVQAGNNSEAANFYKELADVSGGQYLQLKHLDVITDMFLAVCYKETNENMLEDFEKELVCTGGMTEVKQEMLTQLRQDKREESIPGASNSQHRRYVNSPWWDLNLDKGTVQYVYKADTDKWEHAYWSKRNQVKTTISIASFSRPATSTRRRKPKRKCIIM